MKASILTRDASNDAFIALQWRRVFVTDAGAGFAARRERGWVVACYAILGAVVIINAWPDPDSLSVRLLIGAAISFGFVAALSTRLLRSSAPGAP